MRISIFLFSFSILILSCIPENSTDSESAEFENIDTELHSYFSDFETEGRARGLDLDLSNFELTGDIAEIHEANVAGVCQFSSNQPNQITIDQEFWDNASDAIREMVVFHELGHCVLGRGHREDSNNNGFCLSIMRSGTGPCRTLYNSDNRKFYLDELFFYEN